MHKHAAFAAAVLALSLASCAEPGPLTYEDVAPLTHQEQLAAFATASPAEMAAIYRGHFERVAERPDLTLAQHDAIERAAVLVSPQWYVPENADGQAGERVRTEQAEAERLVREALGPNATRAMMMIGPEYSASTRRATRRVDRDARQEPRLITSVSSSSAATMIASAVAAKGLTRGAGSPVRRLSSATRVPSGSPAPTSCSRR